MMTPVNALSIFKRRAVRRAARSALGLRTWRGCAAVVIARLKALAPYALIELILPGGSVMALLLWLYRRRKNAMGLDGFPAGLLATLR